MTLTLLLLAFIAVYAFIAWFTLALCQVAHDADEVER